MLAPRAIKNRATGCRSLSRARDRRARNDREPFSNVRANQEIPGAKARAISSRGQTNSYQIKTNVINCFDTRGHSRG
jgi:hypothetical protein